MRTYLLTTLLFVGCGQHVGEVVQIKSLRALVRFLTASQSPSWLAPGCLSECGTRQMAGEYPSAATI